MNVVYTVPYKPNRFVRVVFRLGLILLCIGSVIFTTIGFLRALNQVHKPVHPLPRQKPILQPYR